MTYHIEVLVVFECLLRETCDLELKKTNQLVVSLIGLSVSKVRVSQVCIVTRSPNKRGESNP